MTEDQIIKLIKDKKGDGSQSDLARAMGITPQYLHDVLNGRRAPGPKILEYLGIEKRENYVRVK